MISHQSELNLHVRDSGSLEPSLKDGLQRFANARHYEYWSQYVKSLVCHAAAMEDEGVCYFPEQTHMLILAWRMLLILATTHVRISNHFCFFFFAIPSYLKDLFECISLFSQSDVMQLTDNQTKLKLFMDVLDATKAAVSCKHFGPPRCAARSGPPSLPIS